MPNPELSIVIVSWNVKDLLQSCLESIFRNQLDLPLEVIVVDNASGDFTAQMIKDRFPQVKLIANQTNVGFATANNQGILESNSDFILCLNPDTQILNDALQKSLEFLKTNAQIGILGCKHVNPDWTLQQSVRRFPSFWAIFFIITKFAKIFPEMPPIYFYLAKDMNYKLAQPVDQVAGSFFLLRKKMLDEIGLFDENFFTWFEEVDLCRRARDNGWQIWYYPEAQIVHHGGQSFNQQMTWQKQNVFFASAWYYFKKHGFFHKK
ncbi:MAG: glycosyltransferase family 2 protein [Candidatus Buchananbacteria bacterium]